MAKRRAAIALLDNWNTLNKGLMALGEKDVARLLAHEEANRNRLTFTLRLHARLNRLRRERERQGLALSASKRMQKFIKENQW